MEPEAAVNSNASELDWKDSALAEGLRCYRNGCFFEAHEHWEAVWLRATGPTKTFLQALIQITAAFHHLDRGNGPGAVSLLTRALRRLESFPPAYGGVAVDALRLSVEAWLRVLQQPGRPPGILPPVIVP